VRVVIGEDEALLRRGLGLLLEASGIEVAAAAGDADGLVEAVRAVDPDIRMPPDNSDDGLRAALQIRAERPDRPVMVLSQYVQRRYATDLLRSGPAGVGYQLKQRIADVDRFCDDLRTIAAGGTLIDPEVIGMMVNRASQTHPGLERLTARQREVLGLIAEGRSNAAIAGRLGISDKAVVQHTSHLYEHLGLSASDADHRRVLAVLRYLDS
jgi:DNA-binding NarL/FixJ family response regulator